MESALHVPASLSRIYPIAVRQAKRVKFYPRLMIAIQRRALDDERADADAAHVGDGRGRAVVGGLQTGRRRLQKISLSFRSGAVNGPFLIVVPRGARLEQLSYQDKGSSQMLKKIWAATLLVAGLTLAPAIAQADMMMHHHHHHHYHHHHHHMMMEHK
ncbi:MAG: hypothetical protein WA926_10235 [Methylovirgula sp.]